MVIYLLPTRRDKKAARQTISAQKVADNPRLSGTNKGDEGRNPHLDSWPHSLGYLRAVTTIPLGVCPDCSQEIDPSEVWPKCFTEIEL